MTLSKEQDRDRKRKDRGAGSSQVGEGEPTPRVKYRKARLKTPEDLQRVLSQHINDIRTDPSIDPVIKLRTIRSAGMTFLESYKSGHMSNVLKELKNRITEIEGKN